MCHYKNTRSLHYEIIASVIKTVAPDSAPELWEAVRTKGKVSQFLQMPRHDNGLVQAIVESYKLAEKAETRRQLLSICASKVTYSELTAHIPKLTRYEFTAAMFTPCFSTFRETNKRKGGSYKPRTLP